MESMYVVNMAVAPVLMTLGSNVSDKVGGHYSRTDSPRVPIPSFPTPGRFRYTYDLSCPLVGNPRPVYLEWDVFYCTSNDTHFDPPDGVTVGFTNNNRTLHISELVMEFSRVCFRCYALNDLGEEDHFFRPIEFDCKTFY